MHYNKPRFYRFNKQGTYSLEDMEQVLKRVPFEKPLSWVVKGEKLIGEIEFRWEGRVSSLDSIEIKRNSETGIRVDFLWLNLMGTTFTMISCVLLLILFLLYATHKISLWPLVLIPPAVLTLGLLLQWVEKTMTSKMIIRYMVRVLELEKEEVSLPS